MAVLTLLVVSGGFSSFQRKRSSFERLDFQFHWTSGRIIVDGLEEGGGALRAGLRVGDEILMVGGSPTSEVDGLKRTLRRVGPVDLLVLRGGETLVLRYAAPGLRVDYHYLFLSFIGFLYLAIGLFTYIRGPGGESTLFFLLTLVTFVVYIYSPAGQLDNTWKAIYLVDELGRILLPPLTLHFFLRFPRLLVRSRWVTALIYLPPALLAVWSANVMLLDNALALAPTESSLRLIDRWEMLHFALYLTAGFVALAYAYRSTGAEPHRRQIKWIYLGVGVGFIPFLTLYLVPFVVKGEGSVYTTIAVLPLAVVPLAFAVAILKYKLWDVEVVIKEVLAYTLTFVFGMIAFSTVNLLLTQVIEERLVLERNFLAFASGLLIAGVLVPMKSRIESWIEMVLYRDTYRHRRAMADFVYELATFHDFAELIESLRQRLHAALEIERTNLFIREGNRFVIYAEEEGLPHEVREEALGPRLTAGPVALGEPRLPDASSEVEMPLVGAGYRYLFPLRFRNRIEGMLVCGAKKGEWSLSSDDLSLISSLTAPVALAIENARLYGRLRRQIAEIASLKEYNENIIESSSSSIVVVAADGTLLTANHAFWELVAGEPATSDLSIDSVFPPWRDVVASPSRNVAPLHYVNRKGEEKYLNATVSPFRALDVPAGTSVLVITDVTERVRLERQLQEKDRLASLGLLAAGVAHEVNTPLTGISSYAQMLIAETAPDDPRQEILRKMEQQTFRASHIVNNLLDFAADRKKAQSQASIAEAIVTTVSLHEVLLRGRGIALHVGELPEAVVQGDTYELQQVVTNLLLNARDAVQQGGNIWIDLAVAGSDAVLRVRDDGRGIPPELQKDIFKPLVTGRRGQGGTGLGLAVSDRIVRGLGGSIAVNSEPGRGAEFRVRLPLLVTTTEAVGTPGDANPDHR
ncbi:MAG: ATP-binding protein [Thermoanaerobaculia bacterium]|nr:ATP-binding protein [Thermoanaerobaculia bacterium]